MLQLDEKLIILIQEGAATVGVEAKGSILQKGPSLQLGESLKNISSAVLWFASWNSIFNNNILY